jgi:site-specific recombinase XerC
MRRGRKRQFNIHIPAHINQDKLPDNCHWDNSGTGRWYTKYKDETGKRKQKTIADRYATLSDLHRFIEEHNASDSNNYITLSKKFQESKQFEALSELTQRDYIYSSSLVENHPTLSGQLLGTVGLSKWSSPMVQKLIDQLAETKGSSAANHALRYTRRLLKWGKARGYVPDNFATGIEPAKEKPKQQLVSDTVYNKLLDHVMAAGSYGHGKKGGCPEYLWMIMEIAYLCRLRGAEVVDMSEDRDTGDVLICERLKRSRTNAVRWTPRLRAAWDAAIARRDKIWRDKNIPVPISPADRPIFVSKTGKRLSKSAVDTAWQRMIHFAMSGEEPIMLEHERFSLHDLKRKGTTETEGTRADKQEATGHRSASMMDIYDKSIPVVDPVLKLKIAPDNKS